MHFKTEILLPSATMRCTQSVRDIALRAVEKYSSLFEAYLYTVLVCSKTEHKLKTNFTLFKGTYIQNVPIQKRIANPKTNENYFRGHLYTEFAYSNTDFEPQRRRALERRA